jgi:hypothetical protein
VYGSAQIRADRHATVDVVRTPARTGAEMHTTSVGSAHNTTEKRGLNRLAGGPDALAFIRTMTQIEPPEASFDAAFSSD